MEKIVGKVNEKDKNHMIDIYEKKVALDNLEIIINSNQKELYDKVKQEKKVVDKEYDNWWENIRQNYSFEGNEKGYWKLDFQTGVVRLIV